MDCQTKNMLLKSSKLMKEALEHGFSRAPAHEREKHILYIVEFLTGKQQQA